MKRHDRLKRTRARELALQALYQWLLTGEDVDTLYQQTCAFALVGKSDTSYFRTLLFGVVQHVQAIDQAFFPFLTRADDQLTPIERSILRLSTFELMHHLEIPYKVILSEAMVLSNDFGATDAYKFVNGVLHQAAHALRPTEVNTTSSAASSGSLL